MAVIVLRDAVVELADAEGELTDISAGVAQAAIRLESAVGVYYTLDSDWPKTAEGGRRGTVALSVLENDEATSAHGLLRVWLLAGGLRAFRIQRPDAAGMTYRGNARLARLSPASQAKADSGEAALATALLILDGEVEIED